MRTHLITAALVLAFSIATTGCKITPQDEATRDESTQAVSPSPPDQNFAPGSIEPAEELVVPVHSEFVAADTDGDGRLNTMEFIEVWKDGEVTLYDTNGDGYVSPQEFDDYVTAQPGR